MLSHQSHTKGPMPRLLAKVQDERPSYWQRFTTKLQAVDGTLAMRPPFWLCFLATHTSTPLHASVAEVLCCSQQHLSETACKSCKMNHERAPHRHNARGSTSLVQGKFREGNLYKYRAVHGVAGTAESTSLRTKKSMDLTLLSLDYTILSGRMESMGNHLCIFVFRRPWHQKGRCHLSTCDQSSVQRT